MFTANRPFPSRISRSPRGFTLVELLVVVAIIAVLGMLTLACVSKMRAKAKTISEINAGKNLITGYLLAASDNSGRLLPGMDQTATGVTNPAGKIVSPRHAGERYPFRLLPYLNNTLEGSILLKTNARQILAQNKGKTTGMYDYFVSTYPVFGINAYLIGGFKLSDTPDGHRYPAELVSNLLQADDPHLLVFASGGTLGEKELIEGYNILTAPRLPDGAWSANTSEDTKDPSRTGFVSFRHSGKAVCVFLDGTVSALDRSSLADMRLWSRNARNLGEKDYIPSDKTNDQ